MFVVDVRGKADVVWAAGANGDSGGRDLEKKFTLSVNDDLKVHFYNPTSSYENKLLDKVGIKLTEMWS